MEGLFSNWLRFDETNAATWLVEQKTSVTTDRLIDQYTRSVAHRDPEETMRWADSISDPDRRDWVKKRVGYIWEEVDPDGWSAYLQVDPQLK